MMAVTGCSTTKGASQGETHNTAPSSKPHETYIETLTLPQSFNDAPNGYPVGLFWSAENVMSKHDGYDLTNELGKTVKVYSKDGEMVLRDMGEKVVGEWTIQDPTITFEQLTNETLQQWVESQPASFPADRLKMAPENTIKAFYQAIDRHDEEVAWSFVDPWYKYNLMVGQALKNGFPQDGWGSADIPSVFKQVQVLSVTEVPSGNTHIHYTVPTKFFEVKTNGQYNQGFVYPNGVNTWIVEIVKPTPNSPWLYNGTPTGGY
jgi:hypothetical protein